MVRSEQCKENYRYTPPVFSDTFTPIKGHNPYQTTYCREFQISNYGGNAGSAQLKLRYHLRDEGLPDLLTTIPSHKSVEQTYNTQYCEDFNKVPRKNMLPPSRYFDMYTSKTGGWSPEKSDHPVIGKPWSYQYLDIKKKRWENEQDELNRISSALDYRPESIKYSRYDNEEYQKGNRRATSKPLSSKFFDPRKGITRGPPLLFQPNEVTYWC